MKAKGPFIFSRYTGRLQVTAEILSLAGAKYTVSAANLLPMRPDPPRTLASRRKMAPVTDSSSDITISDSEADLPYDGPAGASADDGEGSHRDQA